MAVRIQIDVKFPNTGKVRSFHSISRVARMLSGNGTASGGLRTVIERKAREGVTWGQWPPVRNNGVYG